MKPLKYLGPCFECGQPGDERHHVVPEVLGGTMTVLLCSPCHGKVHGLEGRLNHRELTRQGLMKAKARGVVLGATGPTNLKSANGIRTEKAKEFAETLRFVVAHLRSKNLTYRLIVDYFNEGFIKAPQGGLWTIGQMHRLTTLLKENTHVRS
jgi:hypothetical protein